MKTKVEVSIIPICRTGFSAQKFTEFVPECRDERAHMLETIDVSAIEFRKFSPLNVPLMPNDSTKRSVNVLDLDFIHLDIDILTSVLMHTEAIPFLWRQHCSASRHILFDGTVFKDQDDEKWVRGLCFAGNKWYDSFCYVNSEMHNKDMCAVIHV